MKRKLCEDHFENGQIVVINSKKSPYNMKKGVIIYSTAKSVSVRLLDEEKAFMNRFIFDKKGKVHGTASKHLECMFRKTSVEIVCGKRNKKAARLNDWQDETMDLLEKYQGKTREQILKSL